MISSHEAGRCPSLSYDSAEETSSPDAFPVNLMVIRPGARHGCSGRVTRRAVPHVLDAGASHGAHTWRAFASTLTYSTAPASLSLHFCPPGPLLRSDRDCVRSATTLACSAHAPASRCTRPKSHCHLLGGHWMMSFGDAWSNLSCLPAFRTVVLCDNLQEHHASACRLNINPGPVPSEWFRESRSLMHVLGLGRKPSPSVSRYLPFPPLSLTSVQWLPR